MKALVQSYPPLGQVTVVNNSRPWLTVVLEVSIHRAQEPWEVSLWTSVDEGEWREAKLGRTEQCLDPQMLQKQPPASTFLHFSGRLPMQKCASFTIKFRPSKNKTWEWVRDEQGLGDGIVLLQCPESPSDSLQPRIPDLNPEWRITSGVSQSPGTRIWTLQCSIQGSVGKDSSVRSIDIGTPWGSFLRWFALVRHRPSWLGPRQGTSRFLVDQTAIMCCFLSGQGKTMTLLAVSGVDDMSVTFSSTDQNTISVHARNDSSSAGTVKVLISDGPDFDHTVASVMYEARDLVSTCTVPRGEHENGGEIHTKATATARWEAEWYDGLGFCTWNSLGQQLSEDKLLDAVKELAQKKIHITSLIIDDNWQSIDRTGNDQSQYGWIEFEADKQAFPSGLKNLVTNIRKSHPDIRHVLVWHALLGYWGGISPNGVIAKRYKTSIVAQSGESQRTLTVVAKENLSQFYDDFYTFLVRSGIDGVKTDGQVMLDLLKEAPDRRELSSTYLDEWSKASQKHFGKKAISCMSQFPLALFHSQLPRSPRKRIVRNSDDYFPNEPTSHPWHIWANAHNAIFTRFLNVVPDWDMFQSVHEHSEFHAAARCVSGGPIYMTDVPGEHNMPLIKQMTALTPLGRTIVLRPSSLGSSIHHYEKYEEGTLLKIGSYHGASQAGTGILGVFNVSQRRINELAPLNYFPGIVPSVDYVIRAHTTGKVSGPISLELEQATSLITISLDVRAYEILCAFPVTSFEGHKYIDGHAGLVGLTGKMTGCAALTTTSSILRPETGRLALMCSLKALGVLGVFISTLPSMSIGDDLMVTIQDIPVPFETVERSERDCHVLEIDVERAWELMDVTDLQQDEVTVKCSFNV